MKKILGKFKHNTLFGFILGGLIFGSVVYGINVYQSDAIEYNPTDTSWGVSNVGEALNSLHSIAAELDTTKTSLNNLKSIGNATATQILAGQTALVKGSAITGTMTNRGAWTNTPTGSGKVTIPAGYHNGSGYVDTATSYTNGYNAGNQSAINSLYDKCIELGSTPTARTVSAVGTAMEKIGVKANGSVTFSSTGAASVTYTIPSQPYFIHMVMTDSSGKGLRYRDIAPLADYTLYSGSYNGDWGTTTIESASNYWKYDSATKILTLSDPKGLALTGSTGWSTKITVYYWFLKYV